MVLAVKILEYLKETGTTRKDFAEKADVPLSTLNSILSEKNPNPTYPTVIKLARAAEISLDAIAGIKSKDMGSEEIERINKEYEKTKEQLQQSMKAHDEYMAQKQDIIASQNETIKAMKRTNDALREANAAQAARIDSQVKAIFWLRCLICLFVTLFLVFLVL